jgi:ORF6N domain
VKREGKTEARPTSALADRIEQRIFLLRGQKVMLSTHQAQLYDFEARVLVQAVKRNPQRFPRDFMFQLDEGEFSDLKSHFVTSSWGGLRRAAPYAFTEQGVAMLSSSSAANAPFRSTSRSCAPSFACAKCWPHTLISPGR